jgi:hypothetical protein
MRRRGGQEGYRDHGRTRAPPLEIEVGAATDPAPQQIGRRRGSDAFCRAPEHSVPLCRHSREEVRGDEGVDEQPECERGASKTEVLPLWASAVQESEAEEAKHKGGDKLQSEHRTSWLIREAKDLACPIYKLPPLEF